MAGARRHGQLFSYVVWGRSDGWTDLADNFQMDWEFDYAPDGNIALMGELGLDAHGEFTMGLAFGNMQHRAITKLFQALGAPFKEHHKHYTEQWERACARVLPLERVSTDRGNLYHSSFSLLRAHEDKSYPGAFIASLSIPWGETKGDSDNGGHHLAWTRDMVNSASAMLAAGDSSTPLRALIYLAVAQLEDGGFPQNFWLDGGPTGGESSSTKSHFQFFSHGRSSGRTLSRILTLIR